MHIIFTCPHEMPDILIDHLTKEVKFDRLEFQIVKTPQITYASLEWAIPTAIAVYIIKPYFESFLKEAGKDHYYILKKWIQKIVNDSRLMKVTTLTSTNSIHKTDSSNTQSKAISIFLEIPKIGVVKLLFDEQLDNNIWNRNIDKIFDWIYDYYEKNSNDSISQQLLQLKRKENDTFYAIIDRKTNEWMFINDEKLIQIELAKKNSR
jgi:hypothetical protein